MIGYGTATSDEELLKEYHEGLIPQSDAAFRSTLNAYAANRDQVTHHRTKERTNHRRNATARPGL